MTIEPTTHAPPVLLFTWASLSFTCVLARATQRFVMFLPDGTPVRARLNGDASASTATSISRPRRSSARPPTTRSGTCVSEGETLSAIAGAEYGDPRLWRVIAIANALQRARGLEPGLQLLLPSCRIAIPTRGKVYA